MDAAKKWLSLFLSLLLCSHTVFGAVVIDSFEDGDGNHTSKGQSAWIDNPATVIGGIRDGSAGCEASEADGTTTARIGDGELYVFTNHKAAPSVYFNYDAHSGWGSDLDTDPFTGTFAAPVDLTEDGKNTQFSFFFTHALYDSSSAPFFNDVLITLKIQDEPSFSQINLGARGTGYANT
ncbi:MAG: hypothetical protein EOL87_06230 [Spartobacteria bacterium]|nr:hypothetical protein [Spartobacteria bacterium]